MRFRPLISSPPQVVARDKREMPKGEEKEKPIIKGKVVELGFCTVSFIPSSCTASVPTLAKGSIYVFVVQLLK